MVQPTQPSALSTATARSSFARKFNALILLILLPVSTFAAPVYAGVVASRQESAATAVSSDRYFEFHSGFWINLHLFLYEEASTRTAAPGRGREAEFTADSTISATLSGDEKTKWDAAVAYYQSNLAMLDLQTNDHMRMIKLELENLENASTLSRSHLDPALIRVLDNAAPVYRAHWWTQHDQANRNWIAAATQLADTDGGPLSQKIATAYETNWPDNPMRVDVVAYANYSGAFTTLLPTRIIVSSQDPGNQKMTALEVLFHEGSHALVSTVGNLLLQDYAAHKKAAPPDLLHAILYFTTGYFVKQLHPDYLPYADEAGLWSQGQWPIFEAAIIRDWQPHLEGKTTVGVALSQLVADLVATAGR
jgi:hypothetical protein